MSGPNPHGNRHPDDALRAEGPHSPVPPGHAHRSPNVGLQTPPPHETEANLPGVTPEPETRVGTIPGGASRTIGNYRIKSLIATGGMGAVYLAVQEHPRRTVAVKVIRAGLASPSALRRFEYESQILARMRHPGIAQIYEAGTWTEGDGPAISWFAMEYIPEALTLCEYAVRRKCSLQERLELFIKVCEAVQYGHAKGIIHRDLKPANILVDSTGWPKIIDFGVARGIDSDMTEATLQTNLGQFIGTPQYISPEQCSGDPHAIDIRSDVYSLGVVLYELLSGRYPYDIGTGNIYEVARHVCEDPPIQLGLVDARFKGDLETIVFKALEKDRERRYQTVADFMEDIQRHLRDEPILARPLGPLGRAAKWVRRNRQLAAVAAAALLILVSVSTVLIVRIVAAERQATGNLRLAEQNLRAARQNFELVRAMLELRDASGVSRLDQGRVDVEKLLDDAAANLEQSRPEFPSTEADFREILGTTYTSLNKLAKARQQLQRVVDIRRAALPTLDTPDPGLAEALHHLAAAMYWDGDYREAYDLYTASLAMRTALYGEGTSRQRSAGDPAYPPGTHPSIAASLTHLAACAGKLGRYEESESLYTRALEMRQRLFGVRHADVAASYNNIAKLWLDREDDVRAEDYFRRAHDLITELSEPADLNISHAAHNLASCLLIRGKHREALQYFTRAMEIRTARLPPDHPFISATRLGMARCALATGDTRAARAHALPTFDLYRTRLRDDNTSLAEAFECMAEIDLAEGGIADAHARFQRAVDIDQAALRRASPRSAPARARALLGLGRALTGLGRYQEAGRALQQARELLAQHDASSIVIRPRGAERLIDVDKAIEDLRRASGEAGTPGGGN